MGRAPLPHTMQECGACVQPPRYNTGHPCALARHTHCVPVAHTPCFGSSSCVLPPLLPTSEGFPCLANPPADPGMHHLPVCGRRPEPGSRQQQRHAGAGGGRDGPNVGRLPALAGGSQVNEGWAPVSGWLAAPAARACSTRWPVACCESPYVLLSHGPALQAYPSRSSPPCATKSHTEPSWLATDAGAMPSTHAQAQHCTGRLAPSGARSQVRHSRLNTAPA